MKRQLVARLAVALSLFTISSLLRADSYNESASWWFINSVSPNWTCTDTIGPCYPTGPRYMAMTGVYLVRLNGTVYAYAQGGGNPGPCSTVNGGDNFCVFTVPDTAPGWTGQGLTLVNQRPRTDDGWYWQLRSAFYDASLSNFNLLASRTIAGQVPPINEMDAMLGRSNDGVHFTWTTLMTSFYSQIGVRVEDYELVAHPSLSRVWVGTLGTFIGGAPYLTPWKVDWNTNLISIPDTSGTWHTFPIGGTLTFAPQQLPGRATNVQLATAGSTNRVEVWGTAPVSYSQGSGVQNNPCAPGYPNGIATNQYLTNRVDPQQAGSTTVNFRVLDPGSATVNPSFTTNWTDITSAVRGLPSDYQQSESYQASRFGSPTGVRNYVYTGSKDNVICIAALTSNPWSGDGILVTKIDYVP